jgi:hypothetical protein
MGEILLAAYCVGPCLAPPTNTVLFCVLSIVYQRKYPHMCIHNACEIQTVEASIPRTAYFFFLSDFAYLFACKSEKIIAPLFRIPASHSCRRSCRPCTAPFKHSKFENGLVIILNVLDTEYGVESPKIGSFL